MSTSLSCLLLNIALTTLGASISPKLFHLDESCPSEAMKDIITYVIQKNCYEKDGFLYVNINEIEPEFSDFVIKTLMKNATTLVVNFHLNQRPKPNINPNHFKFALVDPEGDLTNSEKGFERVKMSRAKIVLLLTKKPLPLFVKYVINAYWKIQCLNVILIYESDHNKIEIVTFNPYLPSPDKTVKLTKDDDFFYDKTRNLLGSEVSCLLTHADRTKIKEIRKGDVVEYEGKDYSIISTILTNLNAKFKIYTMQNVLINPWFKSVDMPNRARQMKAFLKKWKVSILIKSEQFFIDDEVVDNLYPHTQNDLACLVPKSTRVSMLKNIIHIYSPDLWILQFLAPSAFVLFMVATKKWHYSTNVTIQELYFIIYRIVITNTVARFPKKNIGHLIILAWLLYWYVNNMYLQCKVTSLLASANYMPEIDTIDDVFASGLPLYATKNYIVELHKKYAGTQYERYVRTIQALPTTEGILDHVIYKIDVNQIPAFMIEHDTAVFVSRSRSLSKNGVQDYHLVRESFIPNLQSFKVIHNSPLLPILNKKLSRLQEGGFIELWASRATYNATVEGFLNREGYDESITKVLSLADIFVWFYILFAGYLLAVLALVFELAIFKL